MIGWEILQKLYWSCSLLSSEGLTLIWESSLFGRGFFYDLIGLLYWVEIYLATFNSDCFSERTVFRFRLGIIVCSSTQWDQIGDKFYYKNSPNICQLWGHLKKHLFLSINCFWLVLEQLLPKSGIHLFQNLVTLCSSILTKNNLLLIVFWSSFRESNHWIGSNYQSITFTLSWSSFINDIGKRTLINVGAPYTVCLLIWVAKLETSHVLLSKKKTYRGHCKHLFFTHLFV